MRNRSRLLATMVTLAMAVSALSSTSAAAAAGPVHLRSEECFAKVRPSGAPKYRFWDNNSNGGKYKWGYQQYGTWSGGTCLPKWKESYDGRFSYQAAEKRWIWTGMPWNGKQWFYTLPNDDVFNSNDIIWQ